MIKEWIFSDAQNVAVITTRSIVYEHKSILRVTHDEDDGGWQFHHESDPKEESAVIVELSEIVKIDESINELADLPIGWLAWRDNIDKPWHRKRNLGNAG